MSNDQNDYLITSYIRYSRETLVTLSRVLDIITFTERNTNELVRNQLRRTDIADQHNRLIEEYSYTRLPNGNVLYSPPIYERHPIPEQRTEISGLRRRRNYRSRGSDAIYQTDVSANEIDRNNY